MLQQRGLLAEQDPAVRERLSELTRMITQSPALLARERQIFERYTRSLAALIADDTGASADDIEPWVTANALIGVHRALIDYTRARILAGEPSARIRRAVRARGERALERLQRGLSDYALK